MVARFANLQKIMRAGVAELVEVEGVGEARARAIKDGLSRLAETIRSIVGDHVVIEHVPARVGDYAGKDVSAAKASKLLGWTASTPFEEGMRRTVDWYIEERAAQVGRREGA